MIQGKLEVVEQEMARVDIDILGISKLKCSGMGEFNFSSVQSLSRIWLFPTPWTAAHQASLFITNSQSSPNSCPLSRWCHPTISSSVVPFSSCFQSSQHQALFQWVSSLHQWPKYWSCNFNISPSNEYSGLISFRMDWLDLLAVQGTLKSLLQHYSSKHQFFSAQLSL